LAGKRVIVKSTISLLFALLVPALVTAQTSQQAADELLAADRAFAAASAKTDLIGAFSAMFAPDVAMVAPEIAYSAEKAAEYLKSNPANVGAKVTWTPARVSVSADGKDGFTAGAMSIARTNGTVNAAKYLAYWRKGPSGWRVMAYKRAPAKSTPEVRDVTYLLPKQSMPSKTDSAAIERDRESLAEAERSFSREAQTMGIGPAFQKYGSPDAINLFTPDESMFVMGNVAIGQNVGAGSPPNTSSVSWGPEKTVIAASGDFGVTVGYIVQNTPKEGAPNKQPFFTIWRRESPAAPWRYIAE
jgi:ketosteroid isomerase-like protein